MAGLTLAEAALLVRPNWSQATRGAPEAGKKAGDEYGQGFKRGADGKLRDANTKFVNDQTAAGTKAGGNLAAGYQKKARSGILGGLKDIGRSSAAFLVPVGIGAAVTEIAKIGMQYEDNLNIFQAVTKASGAQMDAVGAKARELGADVKLPGVSAAGAAEAMTELSKSGLSVQQSMDAARGTLQLARAATIGEAQAAEITGNAINAFGLKAKDTTFVVDELAAAANSSSVEIGDVSLAFKAAASVFSGFQGPTVGSKEAITELNTAIAILGNNGIKGSDAGTSLKQMLLQLTGPTLAAKNMMKELAISAGGANITLAEQTAVMHGSAKEREKGLASILEHNQGLQNEGDIAFDASGKMRPLKDIIDLVSRGTKNMTDEEKSYTITQIFGADASRAVIALMKGGLPVYEKQRTAVLQVGAAADVAAAKNKGLKGSIDNVRSQLENAAIAMFNVVKGPLTESLNGLAADLPSVFAKIGAATHFLYEHRAGLKDLATAVAALMLINKLWSAQLAVEAAGGLVAMIAKTQLATLATRAWTAVSWLANAAQLASTTTIGTWIGVKSLEAAAWARSTALAIASRTATIAGTVATWAAAAGTTALGVAVRFATGPIGIIITVIGVLTAAVIYAYKHNETFRNVVDAAWKWVKNAIKAVGDWFTGTLAPSFKRAIDGLITFWHNLQQVVGTVWGAIKSFVQSNVNKVVSIFNGLKTWITVTLPNGFKSGVAAIQRFWSGVQDAARKPVSFVVNSVINPLINGFNKVSGVFGVSPVPRIPGFAEGGRIPGPPSSRDNRIAWLKNTAGKTIGNVSVATGEFVVNARDTAKALPLLQWINTGMQGGPGEAARRVGRPIADMPGDGSEGWAFASGGLVGFLSDVWGAISNPASAIKKPIEDALSGLPGGGLIRDVLLGMGKKLIGGVTSFFTKMGTTGAGAGTVGKAQAFLKAQDGKPYLWASAGPRGYDCCIVAGVRVYGPQGAKPIEDIRSGDRVYSYVNGKLEDHKVTAAWQSIRQPVFAVRTRNRTVTASANHPFLRITAAGKELTEHREDATWPGLPPRGTSRKGATCSLSTCTTPVFANGMCGKHQARWRNHGDPRITLSTRETFSTQWARLDELRRGDLLVQPKRMPTEPGGLPALPDGTAVDVDVAWLIGALVGDGTVTDRGVRLCLYGDKRDRATVILHDRWGVNPTHGDAYGLVATKGTLARALTEFGMRIAGPDKRIPVAVWAWEVGLQRAFLDGYCDADGYRPANQSKHGERTYASASRELLEDVRALHIMLGDPVSNISTNQRVKPITINGRLVKNAKPLHTVTVWASKTSYGEGRLRNNPDLARWLDAGDFTATAVLAIDPKGDADTWDLNVEDAHNFVADGVVVHNSGIVSSVYNLLKGRNPYSHTFSTSNAGSFFTKPGMNGPLVAGWSHPGQAPAGASVGHMMGMVGGLTFESTGSRGVHLGGTTRRVTDFANVGHFADGGLVKLAKIAKADFGSVTLDPGHNLIYNGTGKPEPLTTPAPAGPTRMHPDDIRELAAAIGGVLGSALTGTIPATRVAVRQAGRRPL